MYQAKIRVRESKAKDKGLKYTPHPDGSGRVGTVDVALKVMKDGASGNSEILFAQEAVVTNQFSCVDTRASCSCLPFMIAVHCSCRADPSLANWRCNG